MAAAEEEGMVGETLEDLFCDGWSVLWALKGGGGVLDVGLRIMLGVGWMEEAVGACGCCFFFFFFLIKPFGCPFI